MPPNHTGGMKEVVSCSRRVHRAIPLTFCKSSTYFRTQKPGPLRSCTWTKLTSSVQTDRKKLHSIQESRQVARCSAHNGSDHAVDRLTVPLLPDIITEQYRDCSRATFAIHARSAPAHFLRYLATHSILLDPAVAMIMPSSWLAFRLAKILYILPWLLNTLQRRIANPS